MASEKSRYLDRNKKPEPPFSIREISSGAASLPQARLSEIVSLRADWDQILRQILCLSLAIRSRDFSIAKAAIDHVMAISQPIRYVDRGHGQMIYEIEREIMVAASDAADFAIEVGRYAVAQAQNVTEMFEDDWDWSSSIESLEKYVTSLTIVDSDFSF